jgi:hypothetical protein
MAFWFCNANMVYVSSFNSISMISSFFTHSLCFSFGTLFNFGDFCSCIRYVVRNSLLLLSFHWNMKVEEGDFLSSVNLS